MTFKQDAKKLNNNIGKVLIFAFFVVLLVTLI